MSLGTIDYLILALYFGFVLGIGFLMRRRVQTSEDFLTSHRSVPGWSFTHSILLSAAIVLVYTFLGGLTSAIYNEVLQFFLIVIGFSPLAILAVMKAGGWSGMAARLPDVMTHTWRYVGNPASNPM